MGLPKGSDTRITLYQEDSYGVDPGTPKPIYAYVRNWNYVNSGQLIQDDTIIPGTREQPEPDLDVINPNGNVQIRPSAESIPPWLLHLMGKVTTSGANPYEHVFEAGDLPPGLVTEIDGGANSPGASRYEKANGTFVSQIQMAFQASGWPDWTIGLLGRQVTRGAAPLGGTPVDPGHTALSMTRATLEEGGSAYAYANSVNLTISNNPDQDLRGIEQGGLRIAVEPGFLTYQGSMDLIYFDDQVLDKAANGTPSNLKIILQKGSGDGSLGNGYIEVFLQNIRYELTSPTVPGPGARRATVNLLAYRDTTGPTPAAIITVRNHLSEVFPP